MKNARFVTLQSSVPETAEAVRAWCRRNAPLTAAGLLSGDSPEAISEAEFATSQSWPADLKAWLAVQGGRSEAEMTKSALLPMAFMPLGAQAIAAGWRLAVDLWAAQSADGEIAEASPGTAGEFTSVWIPQFVPIASDVFGSQLLTDLREGAAHGSVCEWDGDEGWQDVRWPSVATMLDDLLGGLESGRLGGYTLVLQDGRIGWS